MEPLLPNSRLLSPRRLRRSPSNNRRKRSRWKSRDCGTKATVMRNSEVEGLSCRMTNAVRGNQRKQLREWRSFQSLSRKVSLRITQLRVVCSEPVCTLPRFRLGVVGLDAADLCARRDGDLFGDAEHEIRRHPRKADVLGGGGRGVDVHRQP